jgi:hypothetical protein
VDATHLSDAQRAEILELELAVGGVWSASRRLALEVYVVNRSLWAEATADLAVNSAVIPIRDDKGVLRSVQTSPYVGIAEKARKAMVDAWAAVEGLGHDVPTVAQAFAAASTLAGGGSLEDAAESAKVSVELLRRWASSADPDCRAFVSMLQALPRSAPKLGGR